MATNKTTRRGYFEIGIYHGKNVRNLGTLWRSAYQLGAAGIFVIGARFPKQASDTVKSWRHVPCRSYVDFDHFASCRPDGALLVGVEMGGRPLQGYCHPESAIYLLGAEDHGLPDAILEKCNSRISLNAIRTESFNVAVAGSIVMYHRSMQ